MRTTPLLLLCSLLPLIGCQTTPINTPGVRAIGPASLEPPMLYPDIVSALHEGASTTTEFTILTGEDAGKTGIRSVTPGKRENTCAVAWSIQGEDEPRHTNILERDTDTGALVVSRMPNRERDVVTRFDPPFIHARARIERGVTVDQGLNMLVADYDTPGRITQRGQSTSSITYMGGLETTLDGEATIALLIRATLQSTFGPAKVNRTTDRWFVPGEGIVGETYQETVRVFGIETESREQEIWRTDVEPIRIENAQAAEE